MNKLPLTESVTVPARTFDRYGLLSFELHVQPDGKIDVSAVAQQANADGWSGDPATAVYLRETDLISAIGRSANPATAAANVQAVTGSLLYLLGVLLADQRPGLVQFPPEAES